MFDVATPTPPPIFITSVMASLHSFSSPTNNAISTASFAQLVGKEFLAFLHRMQARKGQSQCFFPTVHAVERLHCIASRTLHQVIQGGNDHYSLLISIELEANIAIVAPRQNLWLGIAIDPLPLFD